LKQFSCGKMKKLELKKMCTSVAIGFYIRDEENFLNLRSRLFPLSREENSIFSVYDKEPEPLEMKVNINGKVVNIDSQNEGEFDDDGFCIV